MIVEKPSGVRHGGLAIFSIDVQPGGQRFATGGGDQKVRIWHLPPVTKDAEVDQSSHTLLATIRDHFGSVNCVRWAKHGRYIASCSDDKIIHIHEKKPGSGTTEFGSGEPADIENWKLVATLRGHTADVVDLNWSPDDSMLASCSLDNTVHVWNMSDMGCISVLRGHSSLVKGVTWDPIGSFLASQSDDKSVIIWRTSDWSLEHRTEGHWGKSVGSTFFRRLGWSPCGHFVTTTHGFQKPSHSAPVLERGDWSATFDFLGHNAPVVAVRFNHLMFRKNPGSISELLDVQQVESTGQANGSSKSGKKDVVPYNVIAIGSQDCSITVWTTASPRPIFVGKHFFQQSVVDLSWSPDGYSLLCCSTDGSIAAFHFESKELGYKVSEVELDDVKRNRYGDVRGRQASLAESPAQLLLEAAAAKQLGSKKTVTTSQRNNFSGKPQSNAEPQIPLKVPNGEVPVTGKTTDALSAPTKPTPPKAHSPVKQREYRRADGRKRIIPEPVGVPAQQECPPENVVVNVKDSVNQDSSLKSNVQQVSPVDGNASLSGHKRSLDDKLPVYPNKCAKTDTEVATGFSARAGVANNLTIQMCQNTSEQNARGSFSNSELITVLNSENPRGLLSIQVREIDCDSKSMPSCLEAKPSKTDLVEASNVNTTKETELVCSKGTIIQWQDKLYGKATVLAGNSNFWAVGCDDGSLQVYTKCGRRALPTMMVGSAPTFIDCDEDWKLLVVTQRGLIYVWDLCNWTCLLQDSLAPLVNMSINSSSKGSGALKIISARFSRSGSPLIVLATRHAYLLHPTMKCWLRVADDCFPASNFSSSWPAASQNGELASLQADVGRFAMRNISWIRGLTEDTTQTRAHLEAQIASAVALKSPIEYRQNLLAYARCLTRESDEVRLREMCEFFFGPPTGVVESSCSDSTLSCQDQYVLGMKKHELLKEVILPAMASNRKVQRLLNEFIDLLSQYEGKNLNVLTRQCENSDVNMET